LKGINGYIKTRSASSDVLTFELSKSQNDLIYTKGVPGKLETLSTLTKGVSGAIAAINAPFFNLDASSEELFRWSPRSTTIVYTKDNNLLLLDAEKLTKEQIAGYETNPKWCVGAGYTLVENGKISIRHNDYSGDPTNKNPRTMLGQLKDGSLFLVVVQGRKFLSKGMTAKEQAQFMLDMGCISAVNLDGGGSSEMIVNGKIMNAPTDGHERPIGGCFVVVKKNLSNPIYKIIDPKLQFKPIQGVNKPENIIIHHALAKKCTIQDIHKWHLDNGWSGCGYHYFVNKLGEIYKGRADNVVGAHCKEFQMNYKSIGICLEGCYEDYKDQTDKVVPQVQLDALKWLVESLKIKQIYPHNYFATYKKCPGNYFPWDQFKKGLIL
jgi:hypothetical protein